ncbi:hypothetical protein SLEP1_g8137 [Rubroshorea leprosula]|uniref:Uncharacterized protein n=1 Tax=Rubroshorea leprosula TaxID=152421 RepID=A0AAV5I8M9_9ROSI|nr:hypothetical protein SLEP1_g8137 [Rubroshorea leprosula]
MRAGSLVVGREDEFSGQVKIMNLIYHRQTARNLTQRV